MSDHLRPHDAALERLRRLHPKMIDLSLGRMRAAAATRSGDPQQRLPPVIHVAGTNGKGSTVAFLRAIAEAAGLRVHVFTSPHLVRFAERIRLAGTPDRATTSSPTCWSGWRRPTPGQPITFFEITTAAALLAFAETPADLCLIEVGLGGRYDATNVIAGPARRVIAAVDYDHREFLGDTLAAIAGEKAGILKPRRPVRGRPPGGRGAGGHRGARPTRVGAPLILHGPRLRRLGASAAACCVQAGDRLLDLPPPGLVGRPPDRQRRAGRRGRR